MGNRFLIQELAEKYGVSERTIRNDINSINQFLESNSFAIIETDKQGFCSCNVEMSRMRELLKKNNFYDYKLSKEERLSMISVALVLASDYVTMQEMADRLFVSRATIVKDMEKVKPYLEKYRIRVESFPNKGFLVEGTESSKRLLLWQQFIHNRQLMQGEIIAKSEALNSEQETKIIRKIIQEQEHAHDLYLTGESYESLLSYLQIMAKRVHDGFFIEEKPRENVEQIYDDMAKDILTFVTQYCRLVFSEYEVSYLATVLKGLRYLKRRKRDKKILSIQIVTRQFIEAVSKDLNSNLNKDYYLFESLSNHLTTSLDTDLALTPKSSMFTEITSMNPEAYQSVCNNLPILEQYVGRKLSEIESIYITIHICAALERKQNNVSPLRTILSCNETVGASQLLSARLENLFNFHIEKVIPAHEVQYLRPGEADLLISTSPVRAPEIPVVEISTMLNEDDIRRIRQEEALLRSRGRVSAEKAPAAQNLKAELERRLDEVLNRFGAVSKAGLKDAICDEVFAFLADEDAEKDHPPALKLRDFLTEDHIELDVDCEDWREAVVRSARTLLQEGFIEERYIDAMIRNIEMMGAYIIISPGFALPHAGLDEGTKKTGMSLIRLKEPVEFGSSEPVQFFCCLSAVDNVTHLHAFINLVNLLENEKFKKLLASAPTSAQAARIIEEFEYAL